MRKVHVPVYFTIFCKNSNTYKSARSRKRVKKAFTRIHPYIEKNPGPAQRVSPACGRCISRGAEGTKSLYNLYLPWPNFNILGC